jgi:flagellar biosynthesis protein FliP
MVKIGLLLLALVFSELLYSQTDSLEDDYLIMVVDQAPCFKIDDSERKLKEYILKNIDYSNIDTTKKIEGMASANSAAKFSVAVLVCDFASFGFAKTSL